MTSDTRGVNSLSYPGALNLDPLPGALNLDPIPGDPGVGFPGTQDVPERAGGTRTSLNRLQWGGMDRW